MEERVVTGPDMEKVVTGLGWEGDMTIRCDHSRLKADLYTSYITFTGGDILGYALGQALGLLRKNLKALWRHRNFYFLRTDNGGITNFIKLYHIKWEKDFYDYFPSSAPLEGIQKLPSELLYKNAAVHFGKSSHVREAKVYDTAHDNKLLLNFADVNVVMDVSTRRPVTDCAGFLGLEPEQIPYIENPPRFSPAPLPSNPCYKATRKIVPRYIDANNHTNYKVYIWMMMECVNECFDRGLFLGDYGRDIRRLPLEEFVVMYEGEVLLGEEPVVYVWDTAERPRVVHAQIWKDGKRMVFCQLNYYESEKNMLPKLSGKL